MSFKVIQNIPSPEEMLEKVAMSPKLQQIKKQRDEEMKAILEGKQNKFLVPPVMKMLYVIMFLVWQN